MESVPIDKRLEPNLLAATLYSCSICLDTDFIRQMKNLFQVSYSAEELSILALNNIDKTVRHRFAAKLPSQNNRTAE